jgi:hypothetical protein
MRRIYILFLVSVVFFGSLPFSAAQTAARGGIQDQVFVIQKDREIRLPKQIRSFEKMPALPQPKALGSLTFPVIPFFLSVPASEIQAEPAKKEWKASKLDLYPGLVRVGYGNFLSPLVEGRYLSTQSSEWQYATKFYHQSFGKGPVRWMDEESKESHTELAGDVSYFLDESELYATLDLKRDAYTFYGRDLGFVIPTNVDLASQYFAPNRQLHGDLKLGIRDLDKVGRIGYSGEIVLGGFRDSYAVREQEFGFEGKGEFRSSKEMKASLGVSYFTTATEDLKYDLNRNYFSIRPEGQYRFGDFHFSAAIVLVSDNDSVAESKPAIRIFPVLKSTYQVSGNLKVNAAISGDVQRNTYRSFVQENPFLGPSDQLLNTVTSFEFAAGVEGLATDKLVYRAGMAVRRQSNLHFFVNSYADTSRFELVYDQQATVLQFNSDVEFSVTEKYKVTAQFDFFHYNLSTLQTAWHRPTWTASMNHRLTPFKNFSLQANLQVLGGMKARGLGQIDTLPTQAEVVKLPVVVDLQVNLEYRINSRFAVFANGANLLNRNNMRWMNYPVRGIQGVGGLSFKF